MNIATHQEMANAIRALSMDAVEAARSGHPGMPMGMADAATVLFTKCMKFDSTDPSWPDRDRFILSAGHGSMLLYALTYLLGYDGMDVDQIKRFRQLGSKTAGHPEYGHAPGIETTTGPLGQGLSTAVGFAMAEAHLNALFGDELVDHRTYVIVGDGCLMEGISQEAIALAGHLRLKKLIVLWDDNNITIDGAVSLADSTNQRARFEASGWAVEEIDGHDFGAIERAIQKAKQSDRPNLISCKTVIGQGAPTKAGTSSVHGAPLGAEEIVGARRQLNWPHPAFEIPNHILDAWRTAAAEAKMERPSWEQRLQNSNNGKQFISRLKGIDNTVLEGLISSLKQELAEKPVDTASRVASQLVLERINPVMVSLMGGSADLTGSNNTRTAGLETFNSANYSGRYVHYGIREHGMAAAMNGMALHGGLVPYGGAFLVFSDYCRPSIRLSALMGAKVIYIMTHDSIGLGEDGPTHQPVEHLAALRAIPNLNVFRPADVVETAECWEAALMDGEAPSVIVLSRQTLPQLRHQYSAENLCSRGGYLVRECADAAATLIATGSEVSLAVKAADELETQGLFVRVVSMPNWRTFERQDAEYRETVLGHMPRIAIEAAIRMGWDRWLRPSDTFVGMSGFGASGSKDDLFDHFGITRAKIVESVHKMGGQP